MKQKIQKSEYVSSDDHLIMEHDGNLYYDAIRIGNFYVDDIVEETTLGKFSTSRDTEIIIFIYGGENNAENMIPHFHFESSDGKLNGCIKIENAEYFSHGNHNSTLNKSQAKALNKFMKSSNKRRKLYTNWEETINGWAEQNELQNYNPIILEQPDYSKLNNPIYYRLTYNGLGIYEAFKQEVPKAIWKKFLKGEVFKKCEVFNWLPKIENFEEYNNKGYKSYFKFEGYDLFMNKTYNFMNHYIDMRKMKTEKHKKFNNIIYEDTYQLMGK